MFQASYRLFSFLKLVCVLCCFHVVGCSNAAEEILPEQSLRLSAQNQDVYKIGWSGDYVYAVLSNGPSLQLWKWKKDSLENMYELENFGRPLSIGIANKKILDLVYYNEKELSGFEIHDIRDGKLLEEIKYKYPDDIMLHSNVSRSSMNGKYLAVWKDARIGHPDYKDGKSKLTIGLFDGKENTINWITSFQVNPSYVFFASQRHSKQRW